MSIPSKHQILLVDDECSVRESLTMLLTAFGYGVTTAANGFDGLLQLKRATPDVIISDLNMPKMSGFEFLSVVRRRFPQIPVVAISGAYDRRSDVPGGVIADAFYPKGQHHPKVLLEIVADLVRTSAERSNAHRRESAPVWIPRNGKDSHGIPFVVLTCTDCLRSFPLSVTDEHLQSIQETSCMFCPNTVRYVIDFSIDVASPAKEPGATSASGDLGLSAKSTG
jgi:CheY-like chemotaxis protein